MKFQLQYDIWSVDKSYTPPLVVDVFYLWPVTRCFEVLTYLPDVQMKRDAKKKSNMRNLATIIRHSNTNTKHLANNMRCRLTRPSFHPFTLLIQIKFPRKLSREGFFLQIGIDQKMVKKGCFISFNGARNYTTLLKHPVHKEEVNNIKVCLLSQNYPQVVCSLHAYCLYIKCMMFYIWIHIKCKCDQSKKIIQNHYLFFIYLLMYVKLFFVFY